MKMKKENQDGRLSAKSKQNEIKSNKRKAEGCARKGNKRHFRSKSGFLKKRGHKQKDVFKMCVCV